MVTKGDTRGDVFLTVVCRIGLCPDKQLERCGRVSLETLYGAMFLNNQYRWWVEALSRTRHSNKAPVVIDPRPSCIFVGPRPRPGETYVRNDILEQVWVLWNTFLVQRVGINPRQGRPIDGAKPASYQCVRFITHVQMASTMHICNKTSSS